MIERLEALFPQCQRREKPASSPDQLRSLAAGVPSIRAALSEDPRSAALFRHLDQAARWQRGRLSPGAVSALYGKKVPMSASRMDQYQSCHFAYFLRYGLDARARRPAGFDAPEYGTFVHYVLEHVLRAIQDQGGAAQVSDEAIQGFATQAVRDYVHGKLGGMEHQTPRFRYLFRRLEKGVRAVVENVVAELRSSDFQPLWFELGFGYGPDKALPPVNWTSHGITLSISGFVDRVDGWRNGKKTVASIFGWSTTKPAENPSTSPRSGTAWACSFYSTSLPWNGRAARSSGSSLSPPGSSIFRRGKPS